MAPVLFWFRRDLRIHDNAGLYQALQLCESVYCVFVFDTAILNQLSSSYDRRVEFIWGAVSELKQLLIELGSDLIILKGDAQVEIPKTALQLMVHAVYTNEDYEPFATRRDQSVKESLSKNNIELHLVKDQVIFAKDEVLNKSGQCFTVFTPYKSAWLKKLQLFEVPNFPSLELKQYFARILTPQTMPSLESLGFQVTNLKSLGVIPSRNIAKSMFNDFLRRVDYYHEARNYPAVKGVSYLSIYLRFGILSIRELVREALPINNLGSQTWLSELIWRDFYFQILHHFPQVTESAFKPKFNSIVWNNNESMFDAWCLGKTGYPIVDAAMRQINQTGYMHNRLRMVVASFLVKDLLIDWRRGEAYFADHLNDFDLAANNGGWQWAASTGCDAQPYFRIFNPVTQSKTYDPEGRFLRKYLPELANIPNPQIHAPWLLEQKDQQAFGCLIGRDYPPPIVDHALARQRALKIYQSVTEG